MRVIVSAYNILKNIDVASRVFMREVTPHSLFQCSVEALDDGGFNVRIARYPKTIWYIVFFKKFLYWLCDKFLALAFASIRVLVLRFSLIRDGKLLSRNYSFCHIMVLPRRIYLVSIIILTDRNNRHCNFLDFGVRSNLPLTHRQCLLHCNAIAEIFCAMIGAMCTRILWFEPAYDFSPREIRFNDTS